MRDITLMPIDYIVTHIKTDTICEHFINDDVVYAIDERIVPLVRCGECKHWQTEWVSEEGIDNYHYCPMVDRSTFDDWFCADGEREGE